MKKTLQQDRAWLIPEAGYLRAHSMAGKKRMVCEVIAVSGNVGQGTELDGLEEKSAQDRSVQAVYRRSDRRIRQ